MGNDRIVVYINWDGFAFYYYDLASAKGLVPVIDRLRTQGVFFSNAWCGIPSITNPMQTAIASGAYAGKTGNVKVYYDKKAGMVVEQRRENKAENLADAFYRQGISVASVHHFTFEENGTYAGDEERPYVFLPYANYLQRFDELYRILAGKKVHTGEYFKEVNGIPRFVAMYIDDLDTIGHNNGKLAPIATSEDQRVGNVLWRLNQMDTALGVFLEQVEALGIYERIAFFLITDHGMTPFSFTEKTLAAYRDLLHTLSSCGYTYEVLKGGMGPHPGTDIVLCSAGLSLVLSFVEPANPMEVSRLKTMLAEKPYIGRVMDSNEIQATGSSDFCDLYISPKPPYIFKDHGPSVGATHDSLDESSHHIFSLMWGAGIRNGAVISERISNIDFASTMAELLDVDPPQHNEGVCLSAALR
jgi:arylsulfatase A-like enzyme